MDKRTTKQQNNTQKSTTTGTIDTGISLGTFMNFTIESSGFLNNTYLNQNNTFNATLYEINLTTTTSINYNNLFIGELINETCNITNPSGHNTTTYYHRTNNNDTTINTTTTQNYTIQTTDFADSLSFHCEVCTDYNCYNSTTKTINQNLIDKRIQITIINYLSQILTSTITTYNDTNTTTTDNPYTLSLLTYLSDTTKNYNETLIIYDLNYQNIPNLSYTLSLQEQTNHTNITLNPNLLSLFFFNDNNSVNTSGYIADTAKRRGFTNSTAVFIQQELETGQIHVRFGMTLGGLFGAENHTQYYEYINNGTPITEDLEILQLSDWSSYIQVLDYTNAPIKDAIVRAEFSHNEINNWTTHKLLGQRLTTDDGYTFFWGDTGSEILLTIAKDGYQPAEILLSMGDETFSKTNPLQVFLQEDDTGVLDNAWIYITRDFTNRSLDLSGTIVAKGRTIVEIQTAYRDSLGLTRKDISNTQDNHDRYTFTLQSGTDYDLSGTTDITLNIYLDNEYWRTITINYDTTTKTPLFALTGLSANYLNAFLLIALLILTITLGLTFNSPTIGTTTFMIGIIILSFVSTSFIMLAMISSIYYIFLIYKKVTDE